MQTSDRNVQAEIKSLVSSQPVVLFMKGTPQFPQCGFSSNATKLLTASGAPSFTHVNVLADEEIRQGIKEFSSWPTIPQLYIRGEFVGGSDIMRELYESGELAKLIAG